MGNTFKDLESSLDGAIGIKTVSYLPEFCSWTIEYFDGTKITGIDSNDLIEYIDNI